MRQVIHITMPAREQDPRLPEKHYVEVDWSSVVGYPHRYYVCSEEVFDKTGPFGYSPEEAIALFKKHGLSADD